MKRLKTSLLTGMALVVTLTGATAQTPLIDADTIHLKNMYTTIGEYPWLSAYMHKPTQVDALAEYNAKRKKPGAHYFLLSGPWEKRGETALGQWTIQTISSYHDKQYGWGKSTGNPLKYGDRVYLMSRQRGFNMLDLADQPYKPMEHGDNIPVFASYYRDRDDAAKGAEGKGTSAWILRKNRSDKTAGADVDIDKPLYFESAHKPGLFLETHGHAHHQTEKFGMKNVLKNQFWISATEEADHNGSSQWSAILSEESKKKRQAAIAKGKKDLMGVWVHNESGNPTHLLYWEESKKTMFVEGGVQHQATYDITRYEEKTGYFYITTTDDKHLEHKAVAKLQDSGNKLQVGPEGEGDAITYDRVKQEELDDVFKHLGIKRP